MGISDESLFFWFAIGIGWLVVAVWRLASHRTRNQVLRDVVEEDRFIFCKQAQDLAKKNGFSLVEASNPLSISVIYLGPLEMGYDRERKLDSWGSVFYYLLAMEEFFQIFIRFRENQTKISLTSDGVEILVRFPDLDEDTRHYRTISEFLNAMLMYLKDPKGERLIF